MPRAEYVDTPSYRRRVIPGYELRLPSTETTEKLVLLYLPDGSEFDITDRIEEGGFGTLTENTEEDFLELAHGDITLRVMNDDRAMDRVFAGVTATTGNAYEVILYQRTVLRKAPRWTRLFGGVLDLPWSLTFDRKAKACILKVFSYSKMLERVSAETVRRVTTGRTGSVTAGNALVTIVGGISTFRIFDLITLKNVTTFATETHTIIQLSVAGTSVTVEANFSATFPAGSTVIIENPYYRDIGIRDITDLIFAAAGVSAGTVEVLTPLLPYPVPTPASRVGFQTISTAGPTLGKIRPWLCASPRGSVFRVIVRVGAPTNKHEAPGTVGPWSFSTSGAEVFNDWTPYYDAEPANFFAVNRDDRGTFEVSDHTLNRSYFIRADHVPQPVNSVYLDGATIPINTRILGAPAPANTTTVYTAMEVDPVTGHVWVAICGNGANDPFGRASNCLVYWDGALIQNIHATGGPSGQLRYLRRLKLMALHERLAGTTGGGANTTNLHLYDPATHARVQTVQVPQNLWAWSLRVFDVPAGRRIAGLYVLENTVRLRIWSDSWVQVADYEISNIAPTLADENQATDVYLSVMRTTGSANNDEVLFAYTANEAFVIANGYAGVIPYANFATMSCAAALREVCKVAMCYFTVDMDRVGDVRNRVAQNAVQLLNAVTLDEPLAETEQPVWEYYRTSASVKWIDPQGVDYTTVRGNTGDSQHRLELDAPLIGSLFLAGTVAEQYAALLGRDLSQTQVTVAETGDILHVFGFVFHRGKRWQIVELALDVKGRVYDLRLVEVP